MKIFHNPMQSNRIKIVHLRNWHRKKAQSKCPGKGAQ